MNHSSHYSDNGYTQEYHSTFEGTNKYETMVQNDDNQKVKNVCEHLLHLLNEKGNFSPKTRRMFTQRKEIHRQAPGEDHEIRRSLSMIEKSSFLHETHRKRKSDGISNFSRIRDVNRNDSFFIEEDFSYTHTLNNISNNEEYQHPYFVPTMEDVNPTTTEKEISPTVPPLPHPFPSNVEYELSSMATGECLEYGSFGDQRSEFIEDFQNCEFSNEFEGFYFGDNQSYLNSLQ